MKKDVIVKLHSSFEEMLHRDMETGTEFWLARDLQGPLGYARWENFIRVIAKAKISCRNAGYEPADHFLDVTKKVTLGSGAEREISDIALTRYASYLIAQNGDPTKDAIAFAQTYFAVQTRKQEIIEKRLAEVERLNARKKLTTSERVLSGIIFERVGDGQGFARIRSKGDQALFGGLSTMEMKQRLGIPQKRPMADFLPTITIKAKDFANEITNFNINRDDLRTEGDITTEHVKNNSDVRGVLTRRGITPENLPPAEDTKKIERRHLSEEKKLPKNIDALELTREDIEF
ncbi:MAG: DNA damage-inducible protein D [Pseudomonadota bacterium]